MSNNIEIAIICNDEDEIIEDISLSVGLDILRITNKDGIDNCGGNKLMGGLSMFGCCYKCSDVSGDIIKCLIKVFLQTDFVFPEFAVLVISDENNRCNEVIKRIKETEAEKGSS